MTLRDLAPWNKREYSATGLDPDEDCLSCRLTGAGALGALGVYTYRSGMKQLRVQRQAIELSKSKYKYSSRQLGIVSLSASLIGLACYRLIN